jgi:hypothetical protein
MQFYPGDWLRNPSVRAVSLAARGMWMDILCHMHQCPARGYLRTAGGLSVGPKHLARMVGETEKRVIVLLAELETAGVFSRAEDGSIYSRRMVRDEKLLATRRECGRLGGNPNLVGNKVNQTDNQKPTPSSSSSSSNQPPSPLTVALSEISRRIHDRHPSVRRCSLAIITAKLKSIVKPISSVPEKISLLTEIDVKHAAFCLSAEWHKEGGQYAKGLDNWLAPTMRRWESEAPDLFEDEDPEAGNRRHAEELKTHLGDDPWI